MVNLRMRSTYKNCFNEFSKKGGTLILPCYLLPSLSVTRVDKILYHRNFKVKRGYHLLIIYWMVFDNHVSHVEIFLKIYDIGILK